MAPAVRCRNRSSESIAWSRSSASASSTASSAVRVTRKANVSTTEWPGKSRWQLAAITCSTGTNRLSPSGEKRGISGGTLSLANCTWSVSGSRTTTARLRDRLEMYGNGCAGSTARGVSTGKICCSNRSWSSAISSASSSS